MTQHNARAHTGKASGASRDGLRPAKRRLKAERRLETALASEMVRQAHQQERAA